MKYRIRKLRPGNPNAGFDTLAAARSYLEGLLKLYAEDAPENNTNHWREDRISIDVQDGGDRITYEIVKQVRS